MKILHFAPDATFTPLQQDLFEEAFPGANAWRILSVHSNQFSYGISPLNTKQVRPSYFRSLELRKESYDYDLLVVHSMSSYHADGVKTVRPGICIFWLGWGFDYYNLLEDQLGGLYLDKTKQIYQKIKSKKLKRLLSVPDKLYYLRRLIPYLLERIGITQRNSILTVAERIDVFRVAEAEIDMIRAALPQMKADFSLHYYYTTEDVYAKGPPEMAGPHILLGNSSSATNNHIEAFDLLKDASTDERHIIVPLNYGDRLYADEICKTGVYHFGNRFVPLREWLPLAEYNQMIKNCSFVIMNHKRQQAFGNINSALFKGAKVFLRPENPLYKLYISMGIKVFSVEEIQKNGDYAFRPLDDHTRAKNSKIIGELMSRNNTVEYIKRLEEFVRKKATVIREYNAY